ncbi:MAG: START domain-containing protein [Paraperlucidibaca sp.]
MAFSRTSSKSLLGRLTVVVLLALLAYGAQASDWVLKKNDTARDLRVYQRAQSNSQFDGIYAVTVLEGKPARIEAILTDASAMPEWLARVTQAKIISRKADAAIIYLRYTLPYPFRPRDAVLLSRRIKNKDGMVIEAEAIAEKYPLQKNVVRMLGAKSRWKVTAVDEHRVKVELWGSGEPGGLIPAVLYNFNLADDAVQTFRQLRRMALREKYQRAESSAEQTKQHSN